MKICPLPTVVCPETPPIPRLCHFLPLLMASVALLASCIPPVFDASSAAAVSDKVAPTITLASPQDGSPYSSAIEVRGVAKDLADASGAPGRVASLRYEVLASNTSGSATVAADGSFDFTFLAASLHGPITLRLTAVDWNGNASQTSVSLIDSGNGIPGFIATATSGSVALTWSPVPLVDHYELFYETSDTLPSEQFSKKIAPVSSGFVLNGLSNGHLHAFLLKSVPATGSGAAVNWSAVQKVIPLSPAQLVPRVQPNSGSITVSWTPIAASASYEVWKGQSSNTAAFVNISGSIQGSTFVDEAVQSGQTYYYAIKPAQYSQLLSWPTPATPSPFPLNSRREIANTTTTGPLSSMVLSADGRYLYVVDRQDGIVIYDVSTPSMPIRRGRLAPTSQPVYPELGSGSITVPFVRCALGPGGYLVAVSAVGDDQVNMYGRLSLIDVSNPDSPYEKSSYITGGGASADFGPTALAVRGNRVFMTEITTNAVPRMEVVDIDPPTGTLNLQSNAAVEGNTVQVDANDSGTSVYSINYSGIEVFSITGGVPGKVGTLTTGSGDGNDCSRFFTSGGSSYLYMGNRSGCGSSM